MAKRDPNDGISRPNNSEYFIYTSFFNKFFAYIWEQQTDDQQNPICIIQAFWLNKYFRTC